MTKHFLLWLLITFTTFILIQSKKAPVKFDGDFEFVDEDDKKNYVKFSLSEKKKWIHDPSNDLCKPLNCKKKELCLLEDAYTAVCVSKKELHRNRDELLVKYKLFEEEAKRKAETVESNEKNKSSFTSPDYTTDISREDDASSDFDESKNKCKPCSTVKTSFLCGSDNKTYSSMCRLNYYNCIQGFEVYKICSGFCPCKDEQRRNKQKGERKNGSNGKNKKSKEGKKEDENQYSKINYAYQLTPEDLKYDNKHYEFIKFTPDNKKLREKQANIKVNIKDKNYYDGRTIVSSSKNSDKKSECSQDQLVAIGNRLLDWFSVIMFDSKKKPLYHKSVKEVLSTPCKTEVRLMFHHLDANSDGILSEQELYQIEHDKNEECIKPFLDTCDWDKNNMFDIREWCSCFEKTDRPCIAVRRRIESNEDNNSQYTPNCDDQGFYRPIQCHNILQVCWCVDKHGVEFANTRSKNKKPDCDEVLKNASTLISDYTDDDEDDDDLREENKDESSGDKLLMF
ncbi:unnamed protein product [Chironomus riparius]|uniref:Uncharacterized protein n=1 Tax=Chironomus riparius TaxID=315576 RepID=A0A9N9S361_9DIPT|nr:unnamed protein product [Chironomus riparius]